MRSAHSSTAPQNAMGKADHHMTAQLLTIEDAAIRMGMSARYVRRLVAERRITFYRLGRAVRLKPADVDAFVSENRVEPMTTTSVWSGLRSVA